MTFRLVLLLLLFCCTAGASAQGHGPGGGGPPGGGPGGGGSHGPFGMSPPPMPPSKPAPGSADSGGRGPAGNNSSAASAGTTSASALGRWWDDASFAHSIGIDNRQQKRLDNVFTSNKPTLVALYSNLQAQQQQLETMRAHNAEETLLFQQIDRVTQARGDLQKAYAHLQLQIRKELTPDQSARLDEHR